MYSGENSGSTSNQSATSKDTLHISPHIAAHKSNGSVQSNGQHGIESSAKHDDSNPRLNLSQTFTSHVPGYRVGIPTSTLFNEPFQHGIRGQAGHLQVPAIFALPHSKAVPQDLSAHTSKLATTEANNDSSQKPLPHIHSVCGQGLDNIAAPLIVPVSDRCPAYYRLVDGSTLSLSSQHPAMLVSSQNDDPSTVPHTHVDSIRQNQHGETHSVPNSTFSSSMSLSSFTATASSHQHHAAVGSLSEGHVYILPHDLPGSSFLTSENVIPDRDIIRNTQIEAIKEEMGEHKDLVRQALQAAVVHNNAKSGSSQDQDIEYDYGSEDLGELLLMNINMSPGHTTAGKSVSGSMVVGTSVNDNSISGGGQLVVLEPSPAMDEAGNLIAPIMSSRRRRTRLSEEAQAQRREKIANRMREKRANETDEQKEKRRMREAERMRRKRAQEDQTSKERRRREAAERARLRRAKLSNEEREMERKKAAARMRLRRQNENEEQKRLRRIKAAERMRKRRSTETVEQRAARKQNIALRMKQKRQKKEANEEKSEMETSSLDSLILNSEDDKKPDNLELAKDIAMMPDPSGQYSPASHIVVSSSVGTPNSSLSLLHSEAPSETNSQVLQGALLSAVELSHIAQPLSLQVRTSSPSPTDQRSPTGSTGEHPPSLHKSDSLSQAAVTKSTDNSSVVTKTSSSLSSHHHLPHLLHQLTPHQDQHHHPHFLLPHQNQHPQQHQQNQPLQLRHQ